MKSKDININRYYLTVPSFQISPRYLDEPGIKLGDGINLSDPLKPLVAPYRAFTLPAKGPVVKLGLPKSSDVIQETAVLRESLTVTEETSVLSTYFKASYMLSSVNSAYEAAKSEQKSFHTIYSLLEHSGESERLPSELLRWAGDEPPASESCSEPDDALLQFVMSYGSHYVSAIRYGLRIAVQGKLKKDATKKATEFSAAFKTAFGNFAADAEVRKQQKSKLESMDVDLILEATSGGHDAIGVLVLRGFDDISQFLEDVKNNKINFSVAPLELTLKPYWATLDEKWVNTRAVLNPTTATFKVPIAQYGIPKGTIIAWHPTPDYVKHLELESKEKTIVPPPGWAICDGTLGTPDLSEHFIMGTKTFEEVGKPGGETKRLNVKKEAVARKAGLVTATKQAVITVEEVGKDIPANVKLIFIMKLDEPA